MNPAEAIADLMEISAQIEAAVVADEGGDPIASSLADAGRARALARAAAAMFEAAGEPAPAQVEAATRSGSVFAARRAGRIVAAATGPAPPAGLVLYDLRECLRALETAAAEDAQRPRRAQRRDDAAA